jgi:putative flippase GtrA
MRQLIGEFRRYILAGGLAFAVDFLALFLLTEHAGWHYLASATCAFILGLLTNYGCSVRYVFSHRSISNRRLEFVIFAVIGIVGLLINNLCLFVITEKLGTHYLFSKVITAAIVLMFNFSLRRFLLFNPPKPRTAGPLAPTSEQ